MARQARCNRVHSEVTHQVHVIEAARVNVHAALLKLSSGQLPFLGACRIWGVESENRPQRGQFLPDLQAHSPAMGQKDGEKWTAAVDLQPTIPKSDRFLAPAMVTT